MKNKRIVSVELQFSNVEDFEKAIKHFIVKKHYLTFIENGLSSFGVKAFKSGVEFYIFLDEARDKNNASIELTTSTEKKVFIKRELCRSEVSAIDALKSAKNKGNKKTDITKANIRFNSELEVEFAYRTLLNEGYNVKLDSDRGFKCNKNGVEFTVWFCQSEYQHVNVARNTEKEINIFKYRTEEQYNKDEEEAIKLLMGKEIK